VSVQNILIPGASLNLGVGLQSHLGIDLTEILVTGEFVSRQRCACVAGDATAHISTSIVAHVHR
jgi:hypothetical protein